MCQRFGAREESDILRVRIATKKYLTPVFLMPPVLFGEVRQKLYEFRPTVLCF